MNRSREFNLGNLVNLITLVIGLSLGFFAGIAYQPHSKIEAQTTTPAAPQIEDVAPTMTVGSIGTNLVLAHEVDTDLLVVNGFDMMKLQQGIINYLAHRSGAESADFQNLVNSSRATTLHRIRIPAPIPPASVSTPDTGKK